MAGPPGTARRRRALLLVSSLANNMPTLGWRKGTRPSVRRALINGVLSLLAVRTGAQWTHLTPSVTTLAASVDFQHTTVRLWATLKGSAANVYSIQGTASSPMRLPPALQVLNPQGTAAVSNFGGVNPVLFSSVPASCYDSWLSVGVDSGNTNNELSSAGLSPAV